MIKKTSQNPEAFWFLFHFCSWTKSISHNLVVADVYGTLTKN